MTTPEPVARHSPEPLAGLRVVLLSDELAAAYCGRQFAAWGAEVTHLEPPSGSVLRRAAPFAPKDASASLVWEYVAAGTSSRAADPHDPHFEGVLAEADVLITDWSAERWEASDTSPQAIAEAHPRLVVVHVSPFGLDGPYTDLQATDLVLQAISGFASLNGAPDRAPLKSPANLMPYFCGVMAFVGAMGALHHRASTGRGQFVEVSLLDQITTLYPFLRPQFLGRPEVRTGGPLAGSRLYECADGFVSCNPLDIPTWELLLRILGLDDSLAAAFAPGQDRAAASAVQDLIGQEIKNRSAKELFDLLNLIRISSGILLQPHEVIEDEHLAARDYFFRVQHPRLGELVYPGPPGHMSVTPMRPPEPAPALGEERPASAAERQSPGVPSSGRDEHRPRLPLAGVRVLDMTRVWQGPFAGLQLANLGADVIKVESWVNPDEFRWLGPAMEVPGAHTWNTHANTNSINRNKRSLGILLNTQRGREIFLQLVERSDVLLENFTPRVMKNLGLTYEELREVNPRLVYVSAAGYGAHGPYTDYKATGGTIEPVSGWARLFGYPDGPPMMMGFWPADPLSGVQAAAGALVALAHRERTGEGQHIDASMFEASVGYIGEEILRASLGGEPLGPQGNRHPQMAPHGIFRCAGDDRWIAIAVRDDHDWAALTSVAGIPALADARYGSAASRLAAVDELEAAIGRWTADQDAHDLMQRLQAAGVPAAVVQNWLEVLDDPHLEARGRFVELTHADTGRQRYDAIPWRFSDAHVPAWGPPRLGEHSAEILADVLGMDEREIAALFEAGVIGQLLDDATPAVASHG